MNSYIQNYGVSITQLLFFSRHVLTPTKDQPLDLSTAPSSSSNVSSYFMNQHHSQSSNNGNNNNNGISNQFWRKPNTANTTSSSTFTPITSANNNNNNTANSSTSSIPPQYSNQQRSFNNDRHFNQIPTNSNNNNFDYPSNNNEKEERLKIDLKIKESQIESLENEIQRLSESMNLIDSKNSNSLLSNNQQIPKNINEIFNKLTNNYTILENELNDTKKRLESLITSITLNPTNSITNNGRYDELEISHKIILKLDLLKQANEEMLKQLSFGKSKQVDIELNLLKMENAKLKEKLKKYEEN